jgi:hypothetical protein
MVVDENLHYGRAVYSHNDPPPFSFRSSSIMTVGNQYGYLCPNCDKGTDILITANAEVLLTPTGTDIDTSTAQYGIAHLLLTA